MNNTNKEQYCSPECGLVELKMEGAVICTSPGPYPEWGGENI